MTRSWLNRFLRVAGTTLLTGPLGCGDDGNASAISEAAARGKTVYLNVCIACHAVDPSQDGPLGPAVAGASLALLEAKVLRAEYPADYEPVRAGITMPRYEYLAEHIPNIAAFLAETPH